MHVKRTQGMYDMSWVANDSNPSVNTSDLFFCFTGESSFSTLMVSTVLNLQFREAWWRFVVLSSAAAMSDAAQPLMTGDVSSADFATAVRCPMLPNPILSGAMSYANDADHCYHLVLPACCLLPTPDLLWVVVPTAALLLLLLLHMHNLAACSCLVQSAACYSCQVQPNILITACCC